MSNLREQKRAARMAAVKAWVEKAKSDKANIDNEKLIATVCIEFGVSRRTSMEYISILVNSGKMKL